MRFPFDQLQPYVSDFCPAVTAVCFVTLFLAALDAHTLTLISAFTLV